MLESAVQLPTNLGAFVPLLQDERWCISYGFQKRWPDGFVCPWCGLQGSQARPQKTIVCPFCGHCTSITAGTLLHGSKKRLSPWFQAIWWVCCEPSALTTKDLQHHLGLTSYQTAWLSMRKLRAAIRLLEQRKCSGIVMLDAEAACQRGRRKPGPLLGAVESIADGRACGRLKITFCDRLDPDSVASFCRRSVDPGSVIAAPGREPFTSVSLVELLYTVDAAKMFNEVVQQMFAGYRRWSGARAAHRQSQRDRLEEFCFLQNATLYPSRPPLFAALVSAILQPRPKPVDRQIKTPYQQRGAA